MRHHDSTRLDDGRVHVAEILISNHLRAVDPFVSTSFGRPPRKLA